MPTKRRRHAITETPPVHEALEDLRRELAGERMDLSELVIIGAREKASRLRRERVRSVDLRRRLSERIRNRDVPVDPDAADRARQNGWARA